MDIIQFIGFLITLVIMLFLFMRQTFDAWKRKNHPEEYAKEEKEREHSMRQMLKTMNIDLEDEEEEEYEVEYEYKEPQKVSVASSKNAAPILQLQEKAVITPRIPQVQPHRSVQEQRVATAKRSPQDAYKMSRYRKPSRGALIVRKQRTLKDAIVLREVFGKSRSEQPWR